MKWSKSIEVFAIANVIAIHGFGYGKTESWDADQPEALAMVEEGRYDRFQFDCECGCSHYVKSDGSKFANSDYCEDHEKMHASEEEK